jgi:hypothetical protein
MIAILAACIFLFASIFSWYVIRKGKGIIGFIYRWGFLIGAFVWEDLFVFSIYGFVASIITFLVGQYRIALLFFVIFWIVRSAGEAGYFFLQQFIQPKHHPHYIDDRFKLMRRIFGTISYQQCLILMQVMFQVVLMIAIASLILLLFNWHTLV